MGRALRDKIFKALNDKVTIDNRGDLSWALSTKIERDPERGLIKISQEENINELLRSHGFEEAKVEPTPHADKGGDAKLTEEDLPVSAQDKADVENFPFHQIIGKLWWIALISRPDIVYAVHRCAVWQNRPSQKLIRWVVHIAKYLKGTKTLGLIFDKEEILIRIKFYQALWTLASLARVTVRVDGVFCFTHAVL